MSDVIDSILEELDAMVETKEPEVEEVKAEAEKVEVETLVSSGRIRRDDGMEYEDIPFSQHFWEPKHVPDHLVRVYYGMPDVPDMIPNYVPPVKEIEATSFAFATNNKLLTVGPTGAGKTLAFEYMAHKLGRPYLRIEHNVFFDPDRVFGSTHINVDDEGVQSTDFVEGSFPRSMEYPTIVVLDETSRNTGHSNIQYQRALDRREFTLTNKEGGSVKTAHEDWIICGSDNTKGNGDDLDKYSASNVQDQAFINRWDIIIDVDYLSQADEVTMIQRMSPKMDSKVAVALAKFSGLMHDGFKSGEIQTAFSPRNLASICALYNGGMTLGSAIEYNYFNRCTKSEISDVRESYRAIFG